MLQMLQTLICNKTGFQQHHHIQNSDPAVQVNEMFSIVRPLVAFDQQPLALWAFFTFWLNKSLCIIAGVALW